MKIVKKSKLNYKNKPCLNCEDRTITCHSTCEKYKAFRERLDLIREGKKKHWPDNYLYNNEKER